jgi:hypothetical protein
MSRGATGSPHATRNTDMSQQRLRPLLGTALICIICVIHASPTFAA